MTTGNLSRKKQIAKRQLENRITEQRLQIDRYEVDMLKLDDERDRLELAKIKANEEIARLNGEIEKIIAENDEN